MQSVSTLVLLAAGSAVGYEYHSFMSRPPEEQAKQIEVGMDFLAVYRFDDSNQLKLYELIQRSRR